MQRLRKILVWSPLVILALLVGGFILAPGYRHEIEYVADTKTESAIAIVHVQNQEVDRIGKQNLLSATWYGAPFSFYLGGNMPLDSGFTSAIAHDVQIEADGVPSFSLKRTVLDLGKAKSYQLQGHTEELVFGFTPLAVLRNQPHKYRITFKLELGRATGADAINLDQTFSIRESRTISIGSWDTKF